MKHSIDILDSSDSDDERLIFSDLVWSLRRLDQLLEPAINAAQVVYAEAAGDRFRGLHISQDEVEWLLQHEPGESVLWSVNADPETESLGTINNDSSLAWLVETFNLSAFDIDIILIALAPELDLRYERLYAYLQDDVMRKRPTVDLALNLLCSSAEAKLLRRTHFSANAPLIQHNLLHLIPDPNQTQPPLLAHYLKLDEQVSRLLLGQTNLDSRLVPFCQLSRREISLEALPLEAEVKIGLSRTIQQAWEAEQPLCLYFQGPYSSNQSDTAAALAWNLDRSLLTINLENALSVSSDFEQDLNYLFREAQFQSAILYLEDLDSLRSADRTIAYQHLLSKLATSTGIVILSGVKPWTPASTRPLGAIAIPFPIPDFTQRRRCWQTHLTAAGISLSQVDLDALAGRFRLLPDQIAETVVTAMSRARWLSATQAIDALPYTSPELSLTDLFAVARVQSGQDLAALAHKINLLYTWKDIVLPNEVLSQLREITQRVVYRHQVLDEWGFNRKLSLGKGVNALFVGPSGTGKTMAAEIIANELKLDLYKIDLSGVVSKYIGETEKNLERIFTAAENANAILFFDEADALFGKRSEVSDAHDRYANIEVAYLLQKMEQYEGVAILATNLRQNMDDAFTRRLQSIIEFPFPDDVHRERIWQILFPYEAPQEDEIDYPFLAKQFRLTGGNIKNIVLSAAFLAAADETPIGMRHLIQATRREYQKMGRVPSESEFGQYSEVLV